MRVLDLFSGIGGFSLGLERAGMRTVAFCEIDPYCRAVLAKHWPGVPIHGDIRALTAETLADAKCAERRQEREACGTGRSEFLSPREEGAVGSGISSQIDVICGGFPCQDISVAGKGAGLAGARSGLWREYHRLIRELRPRYVIVENVAALLSRGLGEVLGDLASIGYDAEWHCIPASYVGAPHRRDRIWIVAYPSGAGRQQIAGSPYADESAHEGRTPVQADEPASDGKGNGAGNVADADEPRPQGRPCPLLSRWGAAAGHSRTGAWWESEPDVRGIFDGISARLDGDLNGSERVDSMEGAANLPEASLRTVWRDITVRAASQGSRPDEQLSRELADRLPELPYALALAGGQGSMEAATRFLLRLRQALTALGAVSDSSQPTVAAWLTLSGEEAERAFLAACGRADWSSGEWLGVGRVSQGIHKRVDRLRALGNAVVPQVVEIIGRAIMRAEA